MQLMISAIVQCHPRCGRYYYKGTGLVLNGFLVHESPHIPQAQFSQIWQLNDWLNYVLSCIQPSSALKGMGSNRAWPIANYWRLCICSPSVLRIVWWVTLSSSRRMWARPLLSSLVVPNKQLGLPSHRTRERESSVDVQTWLSCSVIRYLFKKRNSINLGKPLELYL